MRLVCPNCATQYEVDDSAVPAGGREVQCGNCSSTWFQAPARSNIPSTPKEDLPKWVDDIVEDDMPVETPDPAGEQPNIETLPNEEIISEPELDVVLEADDLEIDPTPAEIKEAQTVRPEADEKTAKATAQKSVAAALGAATVGAAGTSLASTEEQNTTKAEMPDPDLDLPEPDPIQDVVADAPEAQDHLEVEVSATEEAAEAARKTAAEAAAIEAAEKAAKLSLEQETQAEAAASVEPESLEPESGDLPELAVTDDADAVAKAVARLAAETDGTVQDTAEESIEPASSVVELDEEHSSSIEDPEEAVDGTSEVIAEDVQKEVAAALEALDSGKPIPEAPEQERLSDYDFTDGELAAELPDEHTSPDGHTSVEEGVIAAGTSPAPASEEVPSPAMVEAETEAPAELDVTPDTESQMIQALEQDAQKDQTESLAAKLKARVAEAAKSQENSNLGTAGMVLGASAAGIAASETRRTTAFPKRDTEELASSLRPKAIKGGSLKPRLRPPATPEPAQSRFGQGFIIAIALFALALLVYLFRVQLAVAIPALEPALTAYAGFIDSIRVMIQDLLGRFFGAPEGSTPDG